MARFDLTEWPKPWWEAPEVPYLAALGASGLVTRRTIHHQVFPSLAELGPVLEAKGLTQLWVHEGALEALGFPAKGGVPHPFLFGGDFGSGSKKLPILSGYSKWWKPGGFGFSLHIPAYENSSAFAGAADAYRLLCNVAYYEGATGGSMPWHGGGTITSDAWIRRTYRTKRRADLIPTRHPEPVRSGAAREARWFWTRQPTEAEGRLRYCHALDLNLAYAAVAGSIPMPVGEWEHHDLPAFDKRIPGVWLIEPEPWTDPLLPAPWQDDHRRRQAGPHWVTTPTMERCEQLGYWPIEAYTWPAHHAYMRPWYEVVKGARAELLNVGGPPLEAVKEVSRRGVGRLASRTRSKDLDGDELYQPYWAWAIIAETRARLHRRLAALEELSGPRIAPVAIDTDCVWFLSSRATPEVLATKLGLPFGTGLGQFKSAGTCSAADAREALLRNTGQAISMLRKAVKA